MSFERRCDHCGAPYEAKRAASKYCAPRCREAARKARQAGRSAEAVEAVPEAAGGVMAATRAALEAAGALESPQGQAALVLALRLDAGLESGTSLAALAREMRALLAEVASGEAKGGDAVDELAARRRRRRASG